MTKRNAEYTDRELQTARLRYDLAAADLPRDGGGFIRVSAWCPALGEDEDDAVCIMTNGHGDGRWFERVDGTFQQTLGTMQYHLPHSKSGIRRELKRLWREAHGWIEGYAG